jgi:hypothetical protein
MQPEKYKANFDVSSCPSFQECGGGGLNIERGLETRGLLEKGFNVWVQPLMSSIAFYTNEIFIKIHTQNNNYNLTSQAFYFPPKHAPAKYNHGNNIRRPF